MVGGSGGGGGLHHPVVRLALFHYGLNIIWAPVFFGTKRLRAGHVLNVGIVSTLLATVVSFYRIDVVSGLLLVPYLVWVSFATRLRCDILYDAYNDCTCLLDYSLRSQGCTTWCRFVRRYGIATTLLDSQCLLSPQPFLILLHLLFPFIPSSRIVLRKHPSAEVCKLNPTKRGYNNAMFEADLFQLQKKAGKYVGL